MFYLMYIIFVIPVLLFLPTKIIGRKNIRQLKSNFIVCCNHTSNWDAIILQGRLPRRYIMLGKAELFKNKLLGWFLRSLGAYPVRRGENDIESVRHILRGLKDGKNLLIFPQGTRVKESEYLEIKNGTAMFALKSQKPIVPCIFVKDTKLFRPNVLIVGKPYNLSEMEEFKDKKITKELLDSASEIIVNKMLELKTNYLEDKNVK